MKFKSKFVAGLAATAIVAGAVMATAATANAKTITIRIASGHPPGVVYAGLMKNYFQVELKKRVESNEYPSRFRK